MSDETVPAQGNTVQVDAHEIAELRARLAEYERANAPVVDESDDPEQYVHLSNGEVRTLKRSELPGYAGTNAHHGFLEGVKITDVYAV